jgi:hypothetical protein
MEARQLQPIEAVKSAFPSFSLVKISVRATKTLQLCREERGMVADRADCHYLAVLPSFSKNVLPGRYTFPALLTSSFERWGR